MNKVCCNLELSNAGPNSPNIGLFSFTAIQHIPLKSFAGLPGPALDTGDFSGYFFAPTYETSGIL